MSNMEIDPTASEYFIKGVHYTKASDDALLDEINGLKVLLGESYQKSSKYLMIIEELDCRSNID